MSNSQLGSTANFYDPTFGQSGVVSLPIEGVPDSSSAQAIAHLSDDSLLVVSTAHPSIKLIKLRKGGTLDLSFASRGFAEVPLNRIGWFMVNGLSVTHDQKSIISGINYDGGVSLVRQLPTGDPDASFGPAGDGQVAYGVSDFVDVNIHPDAKFCVEDVHKIAEGESETYSSSVLTVASAPDGTIICSVGIQLGENNFVTVVIRLLDNGSLDNTFNNKGFLFIDFLGLINNLNSRVLMQPDGSVVVSFVSENYLAYIARYNKDGTVDKSYGCLGTGYVSFPEWWAAIAMKEDGGLAVFGSAYVGGSRAVIASLTPEGKYQSGFNDGSPVLIEYPEGALGTPRTLAVQKDGKLVVGTDLFFGGEEKQINKIERYNADGSIDKTFCGVGYITLDGVPGSAVAASLALTTDNRVTYLVKNIWASDSIVRILA